VQTLPGCKGRAVFSLGDDSGRALGCRYKRGSISGSEGYCPSATRPLQIVSFLLTPQETGRRIPATFPLRFWSRGSVWESVCVVSEGGDICSICRVGPCSVLIRNAWLAATGCVPAPPEANFAPTVMPRSAMFRRRWALACGYDLAHSVVTVPRVVPPGVPGSRRSRAHWARSSRPARDELCPQEFPSSFFPTTYPSK
jgi:hypothetical protein